MSMRIKAANKSFIEITEKLLTDLGDMFVKIETENPKLKKDKPDRKLLSKLMTACDNYDIDTIDAVMDDLESCEYESDSELVVWLRENLNNMDLNQIVEKLSGLIN